MKKMFETPECVIDTIAVEDIITTSGPELGENETPQGGGL